MSDLYRPENDDRPNNSAGAFGTLMAISWLAIFAAITLIVLILSAKGILWAWRLTL